MYGKLGGFEILIPKDALISSLQEIVKTKEYFINNAFMQRLNKLSSYFSGKIRLLYQVDRLNDQKITEVLKKTLVVGRKGGN